VSGSFDLNPFDRLGPDFTVTTVKPKSDHGEHKGPESDNHRLIGIFLHRDATLPRLEMLRPASTALSFAAMVEGWVNGDQSIHFFRAGFVPKKARPQSV
jgi:hypothetical protein